MGEKDRKPLDAQTVGQINAAAMKALGDVSARRKWPDSRHGSPLTTNMLCAEIARLNLVLEAEAARVAQLEAERGELVERCANIALAIDSGRGNEKEIAAAIRALVAKAGGGL